MQDTKTEIEQEAEAQREAEAQQNATIIPIGAPENPRLVLSIEQRMLAVMRDVAYVQKGEKLVNEQYRFVSHDAVVAALRPAMVKHGILMLCDTKQLIQEGNRTAVEMEISFVNADNAHNCITIASWGYGVDKQDKGPGKAVSYAVKYALLKSFMLETGEDPDYHQGPEANYKGPAAPNPPAAPDVVERKRLTDAFKALTDAYTFDRAELKELCGGQSSATAPLDVLGEALETAQKIAVTQPNRALKVPPIDRGRATVQHFIQALDVDEAELADIASTLELPRPEKCNAKQIHRLGLQLEQACLLKQRHDDDKE